MRSKKEQTTFRRLKNDIRKAAIRGDVDIFAIEDNIGQNRAHRFCPMYREVTRYASTPDIMEAIGLLKAEGPRVYRRELGLWLTDDEYKALRD